MKKRNPPEGELTESELKEVSAGGEMTIGGPLPPIEPPPKVPPTKPVKEMGIGTELLSLSEGTTRKRKA
jgi:hypothetical protein